MEAFKNGLISLTLLCFCHLSLAQEAPEEQPTQIANGPQWQFGVGLGVSVGASWDGDLTLSRISTGKELGSGTLEVNVDPAVSLDLSVRKTPKNSWGLAGGLSIDGKRDVADGEIVINGERVIVSEDADPDSFGLTLIYGNAVYTWNDFYIPFGLNYSFIDYESTSVGIDTEGGVGIQFGMGHWVNENMTVEVMARGVNFDLSYEVPEDDGRIDYEGIMTDLLFSGKYFF